MDNDNVGARFPTPTHDLAALLAKWSGYRGLFYWFIDSFLDEGDTSDPEEVKRYKRQEGTVKALSTLLVVGLWAAVLVFAADLVWGDKNDDGSAQMGPFGDFFAGVVNPIFTFLTFFGLVVTIVLQRVELGATLTELKLTRQEMQKSNEVFKAQADATDMQVDLVKKQKMESIFFKLLERFDRSHKSLVDERFTYSDFLGKKYSHLCDENLGDLNSSVYGIYKNAVISLLDNKSNPVEIVEFSYFVRNKSSVSGCLSDLVVINDVLKNSDEKEMYYSILTAALSSDFKKIVLLMYFSFLVYRGCGDSDENDRLIGEGFSNEFLYDHIFSSMSISGNNSGFEYMNGFYDFLDERFLLSDPKLFGSDRYELILNRIMLKEASAIHMKDSRKGFHQCS